MNYHAIERTSPKGPGQPFIGRCIRCGQQKLKASDALKECPNTSNMTNDEALIKCIEGDA